MPDPAPSQPPESNLPKRDKFVRETVTGERLADLRRFADWVSGERPTRDRATTWLVDEFGLSQETAVQSVAFLMKAGILERVDGHLAASPDIAAWRADLDDTATPIRVMHARIAFIGELLDALRTETKTLLELLRIANQGFRLEFGDERQIRARLAWFAHAGLVQNTGQGTRRITTSGANLLSQLSLEPPQAPVTTPRYWLCSLGDGSTLWSECQKARIACIGWDELGDLREYTDQSDIPLGMNNSLACWDFSRRMQPGDTIFVKCGYYAILGHGTVGGGYRYDKNRQSYRNTRRVDWHTDFGDGKEVTQKQFPQKTLTDVTDSPERLEPLLAAIAVPPGGTASPYSVDSIVDDGCFHGRTEIERLLTRLESKKNLVLQGPPGTGKTWLAKRLAYALIGRRDRSAIAVVQFHPTLSYEDFVLGWRPAKDGRLTLQDGVFLRAVEAAKRRAPTPYVVVIEEINRGNPAQIFGELITLLEADKRTEEDAVELGYGEDGRPRYAYLPENLHVIGTMNIADRSLALVDLALRRRFAFAILAPSLGESWHRWVTGRLAVDAVLASDIEARLLALNDAIAADPVLGEQFRIGHSYVTPSRPLEIDATRDWFRDVAETEIGPLLEEYWFDQPGKAKSALDTLLAGW